jgi:23S rRNA pseudouridine2605 synthase
MPKKTPKQFSKFAGKKNNAAIKEQFRKEKREWKKEREDYFDKKRNEKSDVRSQTSDARDSNPKSQIPNPKSQSSGIMPLNKFIAHAGICARREAAEMVKKGLVKVNGTLVTEPGHKVSSKDDIRVNGKKIFIAKNLIYILLNKPKDYITTTDDPEKRKTVLGISCRPAGQKHIGCIIVDQ